MPTTDRIPINVAAGGTWFTTNDECYGCRECRLPLHPPSPLVLCSLLLAESHRKLGNPYLRWAFGEAAVIAKRDHYLIGPLSRRLEAQMGGNKFKANTVGRHQTGSRCLFLAQEQNRFRPRAPGRLDAEML